MLVFSCSFDWLVAKQMYCNVSMCFIIFHVNLEILSGDTPAMAEKIKADLKNKNIEGDRHSKSGGAFKHFYL